MPPIAGSKCVKPVTTPAGRARLSTMPCPRIDNVQEDDRRRSALAPIARMTGMPIAITTSGRLQELRGDPWPAPSVSGQPAQNELGILPATRPTSCKLAHASMRAWPSDRPRRAAASADTPHPLYVAGRKQ